MPTLGLKRGTVQLLGYRPEWPELFEQEKRRLQAALGNAIGGIEHIGSTAVPGLAAKPIIDMIIEVERFDSYPRLVPALTALGYEFMPDRVFADRVFLPKGPRDNRTHHVSLVAAGSPGWREPLLFRDYLRRHADARQQYQKIKYGLAGQYAQDRANYTAGKDAFIRGVLGMAGR